MEENEFWDFQKWNIPKVDTKVFYKTSRTKNTFYLAYKVRIVEQTFSISKTHEKYCLFSKRNINDFLAKKFSYLHIGMIQAAVKLLTRKDINASVLMCLRDARFKVFSDCVLGMITASLYDDPVYFNCYPDISLALDDPNIVKALILNIASSGYNIVHTIFVKEESHDHEIVQQIINLYLIYIYIYIYMCVCVCVCVITIFCMNLYNERVP